MIPNRQIVGGGLGGAFRIPLVKQAGFSGSSRRALQWHAFSMVETGGQVGNMLLDKSVSIIRRGLTRMRWQPRKECLKHLAYDACGGGRSQVDQPGFCIRLLMPRPEYQLMPNQQATMARGMHGRTWLLTRQLLGSSQGLSEQFKNAGSVAWCRGGVGDAQWTCSVKQDGVGIAWFGIRPFLLPKPSSSCWPVWKFTS